MKAQSKILGTLILGGVFFSGFSLAETCTQGASQGCSDSGGSWDESTCTCTMGPAPAPGTNPSGAPLPGSNDLLGDVYSNANAVNGDGKSLLNSQENIFVRVSRFLLQAAVLIAVAIMIYGGVMYAGSQGDEAKTKKATSIILYAVYGLLLALASLIIVNLIQSGVKTTTEITTK